MSSNLTKTNSKKQITPRSDQLKSTSSKKEIKKPYQKVNTKAPEKNNSLSKSDSKDHPKHEKRKSADIDDSKAKKQKILSRTEYRAAKPNYDLVHYFISFAISRVLCLTSQVNTIGRSFES